MKTRAEGVLLGVGADSLIPGTLDEPIRNLHAGVII